MANRQRIHQAVFLVVAGAAMFSMSTETANAESSSEAGDSNGWYYCFDQCPNLNEFCAPRGGISQAYCAHDGCWGPNTQRWYDWVVQCGS